MIFTPGFHFSRFFSESSLRELSSLFDSGKDMITRTPKEMAGTLAVDSIANGPMFDCIQKAEPEEKGYPRSGIS